MSFRHDFECKINSFVVALYISIMINILQKIVKILHKKMLKGINFHCFHNGASEKNNSLNGHSNEQKQPPEVFCKKRCS